MPTRQFVDEYLACVQCGLAFVFSAGEQELFHLRGISRRPKRCPPCLRRRVEAAEVLSSTARPHR